MKSFCGVALLSFALLGAFVMADDNPDSIDINVQIHDYYPCIESEWADPRPNPPAGGQPMSLANCHTTVQPQQYTKRWGYNIYTPNLGMVKSTLNANRKMEYNKGPAPNGLTNPEFQTDDAATFNKWWDFKWAGSYTIPKTMNLKLNKDNGIYTIDDQDYFPIDNEGWGNNKGRKHNYGFCVEAHASFIYNKSATLTFQGDDDLWIFLNNRLAFDIGGIHAKVSKTLKLGSLDFANTMKDNNAYAFDMFYCERQSEESHLILSTTMNIFCPIFDKCGVCQGSGECCKPADAHDKCTIATLNPQTCEWKYDSKTIPANYANSNNQCNTTTCDPNTGARVVTPTTPPNYNTKCQDIACDGRQGYLITPKICPSGPTNPECYPGYCDANNGCAISGNICEGPCNVKEYPDFDCEKTRTNPCQKFLCTGSTRKLAPGERYNIRDRTCTNTAIIPQDNACKTYFCAADGTYQFNLTYTPAQNSCLSVACSEIFPKGKTSEALNTTYVNCDDDNACTTDVCDPATGACSNIPVELPSAVNKSCTVFICDRFNGTVSTNITCKGVDCRRDDMIEGCCQCKGFDFVPAAIAAGVIAGAVVGGAAGAAILGFGGKKAYDFYAANQMAAGGVQNNPMYVGNQSGGVNPLHEGSSV